MTKKHAAPTRWTCATCRHPEHLHNSHLSRCVMGWWFENDGSLKRSRRSCPCAEYKRPGGVRRSVRSIRDYFRGL